MDVRPGDPGNPKNGKAIFAKRKKKKLATAQQ
jgi:hypothetical protein